MSRSDNIRRAKDIIANRRAESIATYERHNIEISERIPQFKQITELLSQTGLRIMAAAIGKGNTEQAVDEIHAEYDSLVQQKRALLTFYGYPSDYCDIQYHCARCSDTGYVGIDICDCLRKELIYISLEASGLYNLVREQTFETFSLDYYEKDDKMYMSRNLALLKNFSENFTPGKSDSFLFIGATGLGKTHLSSAVARAVIEKGAYVVYESSLKLFGDFEMRRFGNNGYTADYDDDIDRYNECDLLIIDDLGCEMTNQFTVSCLYNIINTRMMQKKSTIISTNLSQGELRKRYSDRIISRIFGEYKPLVFRGNDVREQKIRKNPSTNQI